MKFMSVEEKILRARAKDVMGNDDKAVKWAVSEIEKLRQELAIAIDAVLAIREVACGENQVADDDSEGMGWIYRRCESARAKLKVTL